MQEGSSATDSLSEDLTEVRKQEEGSRKKNNSTNSRLPIPNYRLPITDYQLPIFNGQLECNDPGPKHRKH
jgi:hypothetical protein